MGRTDLYRGFLLLLGILLVSGCAREAYNISWTGVVVDKTTGKPVKHASISAASSYQVNIDETAEMARYAVSDEYGRFNIAFQRGFGLTVRTSAMGYLSGLDYKVIRNSSLKDTIFLSPHPFNASLVVRKAEQGSFSSAVPYIREKKVVDRNGNGSGKLVKWGFDFLSGNNTVVLDSADVWIEVNKKTGRIELKSSANGGVFPVLQKNNSDFMTHVTKAPESGYSKSHVLTGEEAGFFVLCRNGINVAKMIPEERVCILSYEEADGSRVKETGIRFDYLFQPDLQNRLYFPVSASLQRTESPSEAKFSGIQNDYSEVDNN